MWAQFVNSWFVQASVNFSFLVLFDKSFHFEVQKIGKYVDHIPSLGILIAESKIGNVCTLMELNGAIIAQQCHSESIADDVQE